MPAFVACYAAVNLAMTYMNPLSLYALLVENTLYLVKGGGGVAFSLRTAIENDDFHLKG